MFQHINTYQVPNIDYDVPGIITESEYEKLEKRKSSVCTGVCVSVLIPHPPEMSVDYVQALYWYTTAVVVTNYETETAVYQYNKMHHPRYSSSSKETTVSSQCNTAVDNATPTYWIRKAEHTQPSNPDNLRESTSNRFGSAGRV